MDSDLDNFDVGIEVSVRAKRDEAGPKRADVDGQESNGGDGKWVVADLCHGVGIVGERALQRVLGVVIVGVVFAGDIAVEEGDDIWKVGVVDELERRGASGRHDLRGAGREAKVDLERWIVVRRLIYGRRAIACDAIQPHHPFISFTVTLSLTLRRRNRPQCRFRLTVVEKAMPFTRGNSVTTAAANRSSFCKRLTPDTSRRSQVNTFKYRKKITWETTL